MCAPMSGKRGAVGASFVTSLFVVATLFAAVTCAAESADGGGSALPFVNAELGAVFEFRNARVHDDDLSGGVQTGGAERALLATPTCPTGSEYDAAAGKCLVVCRGGQYRSINATSADAIVVGKCVACPVGAFREVDDTVKDACRACPVGTSNPRAGQIACVPCYIQGPAAYQDEIYAVSCKTCPANTLRISSQDTEATGVSVAECTCAKGFYHPAVNRTGESCLDCPKGADCAGGTSRALSKPLYYGLPAPHDSYFLRCHRMVGRGPYPGMGRGRRRGRFIVLHSSYCHLFSYKLKVGGVSPERLAVFFFNCILRRRTVISTHTHTHPAKKKHRALPT